MYAKTSEPIGDWTGPAAAAFEFWVSLWPTAPLFGVEWRFADSVAQWTPLTGARAEPAATPPAKAAPAEVAPVIEAAAESVAVPVAEVAVPVAETAEPGVPASLMVEAPADADDLTVIKGVGPALARQLNGLGVYKLSQLAGFSEEDLAWVDSNLSSFRGRCFRDDWIGQAKALLG